MKITAVLLLFTMPVMGFLEQRLFLEGKLTGVLLFHHADLSEMDSVYETHYYIADEVGISRLNPDFDWGHAAPFKPNIDGFVSRYTISQADSLRKATQKKLALFIGDSFTQGETATPRMDSSFYGLTSKNAADSFIILNFGIGGADARQYQLIVNKYVPLLKPDAVFVFVNLNDDRIKFIRTALPYVPFFFSTNAGLVLTFQSLGDTGHSFADLNEAMEYYRTISLYQTKSLAGKHARLSILSSNVFLFAKNYKRIRHSFEVYEKQKDELPGMIRQMKDTCAAYHCHFISVGIPSVIDLLPPSELAKKHKEDVGELVVYPLEMTETDYVRHTPDGKFDFHLNNTGHHKYAEWLLLHLNEP